MKTLKYIIATTFIALVVYSNTAKAEVIKASDWEFIPEQGMELTVLKVKLTNTTDKPVRALTAKITCTSLLEESHSVNVKMTSAKIPANGSATVRWRGVSLGGYGGIWDFVETGNVEDFTCIFVEDKVIQ
jgi:hypothetical protein